MLALISCVCYKQCALVHQLCKLFTRAGSKQVEWYGCDGRGFVLYLGFGQHDPQCCQCTIGPAAVVSDLTGACGQVMNIFTTFRSMS